MTRLDELIEAFVLDVGLGTGYKARLQAIVTEAKKECADKIVSRTEPTCVWLSNGYKVRIERAGMKAWLVVEPIPQVVLATLKEPATGDGL